MRLLQSNAEFRVLWVLNIVSSMVSWSLGIALSVHIYLLTQSALLTSVLVATSPVAAIAFGVLAGSTADRYNPVRIVQSSLLIRVLLLVMLFGVSNAVPGLMVAVFLQATVQQFYIPAQQVLVASYVSAEELPEANGLNSFASNGTRMIAPALGGFAITWLGFRWMVLGMSVLMTLSFLWSLALTTAAADRKVAPRTAARGGVRDLVRTHARVRGLVLLQLLDALKEGPLSALFPVLMLGVIGATAGEMGTANSAFAVTAVLAGPLVGATVRRLGFRLPVVAGAAVANALIVLLAVWPSTPMALAVFALSGLPFTLSWVSGQTWLLLTVPESARGRVVGTTGALYATVLVVTMLAAGALAELVGVRWVIGTMAAIAVAGLISVDRLVTPNVGGAGSGATATSS